MSREALRQTVVEALIPRMNGVYDTEYMIQQAEKIVEYLYNGSVPALPAPPGGSQLNQTSCPPTPQAPSTNSKIRDYVKRP